MISIHSFVFNPFAENTYIVSDETRECAIIDPGCYTDVEQKQLQDYISEQNLKPVLLINTHGHIDHVLGNFFVQKTFDLGLSIHKVEVPTLKSVVTYAPSYGFAEYSDVEPEFYLSENKSVKFGNSSFEVLFVPGHSEGHIALINRAQNICISGDVLFESSIGRTDLPGGDFDTLIQSIRTKLFALPDNMVVYPGHGPTTTIGKEKTTNPFCAVV